jgi:hypothetical protein
MTDLESLAGGLIVCGFDGPDVPTTVERWLSQDWVAGLILFKRNIEDVEQAAFGMCRSGRRTGGQVR